MMRGQGRGSLFTKARVNQFPSRNHGFLDGAVGCQLSAKDFFMVSGDGLSWIAGPHCFRGSGFRLPSRRLLQSLPRPCPFFTVRWLGCNAGSGGSLIKGGNRKFHQRFFEASMNRGFAEEEAVRAASLISGFVEGSAGEKFCSALPCKNLCRI